MTRPLRTSDQPPGTTRTLVTERRGREVISRVRRSVLPGGLRVVTETVPGARSAAAGVWVGAGSVDEVPRLSGTSHFLEHLLFKGTSRRTALDISVEMESVGGELNAFTARELTCYHASVLEENLPLAVDVLADLVSRARLAPEDVENERAVILDEIAMHDDDPEDALHELFSRHYYGGHPLGRPVAGLPESIKRLTRDQINGYYRRRYRPENLVFAVAGAVEHQRVVRLVQRSLRDTGMLEDTGRLPRPPRPHSRVRQRRGTGVVVRRREQEQANLTFGVPGLARGDERRYALAVLNTAVGGGTSSRLFQEVRERRGLAYGVYSTYSSHAAAGTFAVGAGCLPSRARQVIEVCRAVLRDVAEHGLDAAELRRAQGQLKGGYVLGLEDSGSRMLRLGQSELLRGEVIAVSDFIRRVDTVTRDDVAALARDLLTAEPTLAVVGPFDGPADFAGVLD